MLKHHTLCLQVGCISYLPSTGMVGMWSVFLFFFQAEDGIRDLVRSRGLGDVYKRQTLDQADAHASDPGHLSGHAACHRRIRPPCRRPGRCQQHRVRSCHPAPGGGIDHRMDGSRRAHRAAYRPVRSRRHDALGRPSGGTGKKAQKRRIVECAVSLFAPRQAGVCKRKKNQGATAIQSTTKTQTRPCPTL